MAHELALRSDGTTAMAFVGTTPWHGLGQSVTKGASIGVWQKEAGMNWEAIETPVHFEVPGQGGRDLTKADGYKMLYRSDNKQQLAIVGADYQVVQPMEILEFFRDLTEQSGWYIHTAGVLREGRKVWAMATTGEQANVGKKDSIIRNLVLATSLDGSMKTTAIETSVRVVCANTLALAMLDRGSRGAVTVSHRTAFDPSLVKRAMGINEDHFKVFMARAQELADTPIKMDQARDILRTVFQVEKKTPKLAWLGNLADINIEPETEDPRSVSMILGLFDGDGMGSELKTSKGTKWGLINAVTEHVDHYMGRTDDSRLDGAWFGRGAQIKQRAVDLIVEA